MRARAGEPAVNEEIRIRPMMDGDVEAVMCLAGTVENAPHWDARAYEAAVARALSLKGIALVAEGPQSGVAGFIIGGVVVPDSEIESVAVRPEMQRRGIARRLLGGFADAARELGCSLFLLEVRASNQPARAFYAALGFVETGRRPGYYANPGEDAVLMGRGLD
jgi:ribosomal-protein-alanine acetyltransferase